MSAPNTNDPREILMPRKLIRSTLAGLAALGLGLGAHSAGAAEVPADQAPAEWVAYATNAMATLRDWLNAETPPAPRVRAVLDATRPAPDQPTPALIVRLWIDGQGTITRAEFPPLADASANADLQTLLVGRQLPPPPRRMRWPMRVALQLPPPPAPATPTGADQTAASGRTGASLVRHADQTVGPRPSGNGTLH